MSLRLLAGLVAFATLSAGCLTNAVSLDPQGVAGNLLPADEALWIDPQNAPHPAFGWPTLSSPVAAEAAPAWWRPIPPATLPDAIGGIELHGETREQFSSGAGIALFGSVAVVPGFGEPSHIVDISDPAAPKMLAEFEGEGTHRGAGIIAYPDGRLVTVISTPAGIEVWDIEDPTMPEMLTLIEPPTGSHKLGVVPGTPLVYNANSKGGTGLVNPDANMGKGSGQTEIYDLTDPASPVLVQEFGNGYGCHHIYFWIGEEKQRAACAGLQMTQLWDIADPREPVVLVNIPVHHGVASLPSTAVIPVTFSHAAMLNDDGTILVVGDETLGGPGPSCDGPGPGGNLWFYDVKDETDPKLLGWVDPGPAAAKNRNLEPGFGMVFGNACTAHHGRLVPDPAGERDLLAWGFYGAGVVLVDFTDPRLPEVVDQFADGTVTWEVWYYNGYLFTGDMARGLDVLTFV